MAFLYFLNILSELIQLVFDLGVFTRKYLLPVVVYLWVATQYYIIPAFSIPHYYFKVRAMRLAAGH